MNCPRPCPRGSHRGTATKATMCPEAYERSLERRARWIDQTRRADWMRYQETLLKNAAAYRAKVVRREP